MTRTSLAFLAVATIAAEAWAIQPETRRGPSHDPNEIVCVRERHIESPLRIRRVCRTRAEWIEHRRQARQMVEKVQNAKTSF